MERPELQKICRQCERDPVIMRTRTHTAEGQPCPSDVPNTPLLSPHKHSLFHSCCIKVQFGVLRELCTHEAITVASVMTTSARVERACAPAVLPLRPCPAVRRQPRVCLRCHPIHRVHVTRVTWRVPSAVWLLVLGVIVLRCVRAGHTSAVHCPLFPVSFLLVAG